EEGAEVVIKAAALLDGSGEEVDLDAGLEEEVEERGDGGEEGLAAAAAGPDDCVDLGLIEGIAGVVRVEGASFEEGVGEVLKGGGGAVHERCARDAEVDVRGEEGMERLRVRRGAGGAQGDRHGSLRVVGGVKGL